MQHILTEIKIKIAPVLLDAAQDHFNVSGVPIDAFFLPTWMFIKLSGEPEFEISSVGSMGKFFGRFVFRCDKLNEPIMREKHDSHNHPVFYERNLRTKP